MRYLCCLIIYYFIVSAFAQAFEVHLNVTDNLLSVAFDRQVVVMSPPPLPAAADCLVFSYRLSSTPTLEAILPDWPLLLLLSEQEVIFYATSSTLDEQWRQVVLDKKYLGQELHLWQNDLALGLVVETTPLLGSIECELERKAAMSDLLLVREENDSLAVLFKQSDPQGGQARYELVCVDEAGEEMTASRTPLLNQEHFSWPVWLFNFDLPAQGELIFQVSDFACQQQALVRDLFTGQVISNAIVRVKDL